jgi:hypothetical protein
MAVTYRSSKIYRDPGHLHVCPVEVVDGFLGHFIASEANETHAPFWQDMGIRDSEAACKMIAKLVIGASRRKPTDKHPSVLHYECLQAGKPWANAVVKKFTRNFFSDLYGPKAVKG